MPTLLNKPITRETKVPAKFLGREGAPIIVTLHPDGRIILKEKYKQRDYALDLQILYNQAVIADAEGRNRK